MLHKLVVLTTFEVRSKTVTLITAVKATIMSAMSPVVAKFSCPIFVLKANLSNVTCHNRVCVWFLLWLQDDC